MATTGSFNFPMWGRPSLMQIPARRVSPFAELMAGLGEGMKAYGEAKERKTERQMKAGTLEEQQMEKRGLYPDSGQQQQGYEAPPEGLEYGRSTGRPYTPFTPKVIGRQTIDGQNFVLFETAPGKISIQAGPTPKKEEIGTITLQDPQDSKIQKTFRRVDNNVDLLLSKGWTEVKTPAAQVNIDMGDITKATKGKLEDKIVNADETLDALSSIESAFDEEYLQYEGKGKAYLFDKLDKVGYAPEKAKQYITNYTNWATQVDLQTFLYRKLITGVAGGEKEMKAIEQTTINTKYDSPTKFKAKTKIMRINTTRAKQRAQYALEHFGKDFGELTSEQKADVAKRFPLIAKIDAREIQKTRTPDAEADEYLRRKGFR